MSAHTPEPWSFVSRGDYGDGEEADLSVLFEGMRGTLKLEDARRIVACVNACEGLPTESLEKVQTGTGGPGFLNIAKEAFADVAAIQVQRNEMRAALIEYIAAADNSMTSTDDVAAMLRFGEADKAARAAIAKATGDAP
jgi:hypothetical protein